MALFARAFDMIGSPMSAFFKDDMDGLLSIRLLMDFLLGEGSCSICDFFVVSAISRNLCFVIWVFSSVFKNRLY